MMIKVKPFIRLSLFIVLAASLFFGLFNGFENATAAVYVQQQKRVAGDSLVGISQQMTDSGLVYFVHKGNALHGFWIRAPFNTPYAMAGKPMPADWNTMPVRKFVQAAVERNFSYSQMCSKPPQQVNKTFSYGGIPWQHDHMKASGFEIIRKRRADVINMYEGSKDLYGVKDMTDINIILDLNAVEMMPKLLSYEMKLRPFVLACINNHVVFDSSLYKISEIHYITQSYACVVSTMVMLLRQEQYTPLLKSEQEREFMDKLRISSKDTVIPAKSREMVFNDPVYRFSRTSSFRTDVPLTADFLDQLESWAEAYCGSVLPEAKKTAAKRMTTWPVIR